MQRTCGPIRALNCSSTAIFADLWFISPAGPSWSCFLSCVTLLSVVDPLLFSIYSRAWGKSRMQDVQ